MNDMNDSIEELISRKPGEASYKGSADPMTIVVAALAVLIAGIALFISASNSQKIKTEHSNNPNAELTNNLQGEVARLNDSVMLLGEKFTTHEIQSRRFF